MIGVEECARAIGVSFVGCVSMDFVLRGFKIKDSTARYFAVHALFNTLMVVTCFPDVVQVFRAPDDCLNGEYSDVQTAWTVGLHLMHVATAYHKLTPIDWAHHLVSCFLLCGLCFPFRYGPILNYSNFFLCGLPGGLDYYLLFFAKMNWVDKFTEKKINRWLNMCIRLPGIVMMMAFAWVGLVSGKYHISPWLLGFQGLLDMYNAIFFADRVVGDYYLAQQMKTLEKKAGQLQNDDTEEEKKYS